MKELRLRILLADVDTLFRAGMRSLLQVLPKENLRRFRSRMGAAMALVSCIAMADDTARGSFAAWAIGLPDGYIIMEHQETVIHLTAVDVARGIVEVRGGSRLVITTHAPSHYAVDFLSRSTVFRLIGINGMGAVAEFSPTGASVALQQVAGRHVVTLDYRFALAPGTPPGTYPWPLELAAHGIAAGDAGQVARDRRDMASSEQPPCGHRNLLRHFDCGALPHVPPQYASQIGAGHEAPMSGPSPEFWLLQEEAFDP